MAGKRTKSTSQPPSPRNPGGGVEETKDEEPEQAPPTEDPRLASLELQIQKLQQELQEARNQQQQLQQQQQQAPPAGTGTTTRAPSKFALTPAQATTGFLDYETKAGYSLYNKAITSVYDDVQDKYDLDMANTQNFLNKIGDRGVSSNLSILQPPTAADQIGLINGTRQDFCKHHGEIPFELIKTYAKSYLGKPTREAQDDNMLLQCLKASLSSKAYNSITSDPEEYTIDGNECGLLLFKYILSESAIDTSVNPDTIRAEIAASAAKFAELNYSVRQYADWLRVKTSQLKQKGATTTDIRTHCMTALLSHPDDEMQRYVQSQRDYIRDHPTVEYSYKLLLNRVKDKEDAMNRDLQRAQISPAIRDDPIVTLRAEIKEQRKVIDKLAKANKNGGGGKGAGKKKNGKKKDQDSEKIPYPKELRKKPPPSDTSKPITVEGHQYWYCTHHKRWVRHSSDGCKKGQEASKASTPAGDRAGRAVSAFQAIRTGGKTKNE